MFFCVLESVYRGEEKERSRRKKRKKRKEKKKKKKKLKGKIFVSRLIRGRCADVCDVFDVCKVKESVFGTKQKSFLC